MKKIARYNDWERKHSHGDRVQVDSFERGPKATYSRKSKYPTDYTEET